jgi:hypothetical protein
MSVTIESAFHFGTGRAGQKRLRSGRKPPPPVPSPPPQRIPRISRLMALAIHFDGLIRDGIVRDYADLARLGGVSRARITQIMNLLNLPPWKQEELLFLEGGAGVTERRIRRISEMQAWKTQFSCYDIEHATRTSEPLASACVPKR